MDTYRGIGGTLLAVATIYSLYKLWQNCAKPVTDQPRQREYTNRRHSAQQEDATQPTDPEKRIGEALKDYLGFDGCVIQTVRYSAQAGRIDVAIRAPDAKNYYSLDQARAVYVQFIKGFLSHINEDETIQSLLGKQQLTSDRVVCTCRFPLQSAPPGREVATASIGLSEFRQGQSQGKLQYTWTIPGYCHHETYKEMEQIVAQQKQVSERVLQVNGQTAFVQRVLQNYITVLDPQNQYFSESERKSWTEPDVNLVQRTVDGYADYGYQPFYQIYYAMQAAVGRQGLVPSFPRFEEIHSVIMKATLETLDGGF